MQRALNPAGTPYEADSGATTMANPDHVMTIAQLQPDGTLTGDIVFDIPKDAAIAHLDLHELPSTPGAKVKVG